MTLSPGTRLGPYDIVAALGAGGMGEVFRARDTNLNRDVAIKVLPAAFASDHERVARFKREAQVLASLNHPNIAAIYGLEDVGARHASPAEPGPGMPGPYGSIVALIMELVEGEDLSALIAHGAIPIAEALPIARQIAEALEAAHEQGIVHRDLKPGNIKVRADGTVKVLDFGLAKAMDPSGASNPNVSHSPTLTHQGTQAGMIIGTAAYMSPEQAKGKSVDKRADIWAFGVVLYEMLTGRRAFRGEDVSDTLASVLKDTLSMDALPAGTPLRLRRVIERCLERDLKNRLRDIGEARFEISKIESGASDASATPAAATAAAASRERNAWRLAGAAAIVAALLAVPAVRHLSEAPPPALPETRTEIVTPEGSRGGFALSPDGRQVVFSSSSNGAVGRLFIRSLAETTARSLPGTEGAAAPFWSPDGRSIGFLTAGSLKRLDLDGTAPKILAPVGRTLFGTWGADDVILIGSIAGPLMRVPASGGAPTPMTALANQQTAHGFPFFLPDGRRFLYTAAGAPEAAGVYLGTLDGGAPKWLTSTAGLARYWSPGPGGSDRGWLLQGRSGVLVAQPLDLERATVADDVVTVAESVQSWSVSTAGLVAYQIGDASRFSRQLSWLDVSGKPLEAVGEPDDLGAFALSPDGRNVAVTVAGPLPDRKSDIWMLDVVRGLRTRFTFAGANEDSAIWSPDGRSVVFASSRKGHADLYRKSVDGAIGSEELLYADDLDKAPWSWSRDGKFLLYTVEARNGKRDIWVLPRTAGGKPFPYEQTEFSEAQPAFSPDGRWVAFVSDASGSAEVYAAPFPGPGARRLISSKQAGMGQGGVPIWRADGSAIYYIAPDRTLMVVDVSFKGGALEAGLARPLFRPITAVGGHNYEVSKDGKRVLTYATSAESANAPITLIQNWRPEVRK